LLGKCDLVLEAASVKAALPVAEAALKAHKPLVMMSTGAYLLNRKKLEALAHRTGTKLYLPSGAVCGMDGIRAARQLGTVTEARITSTKPPRGFQGAPGISPAMAKKLSRARKPLVLYNGGVLGAIRSFPANVNVAATTALALGRPEKLRVQVIADPKAKLNQHEIVLSGSFGRLRTLTQNVPSKLNPKTSALAIQAALALLERLASPVEVGA
jgi:aspartate dehydrogenase